MITSTTDVTRLGTILGIWAHPDDEAYLSGGLMAVARDSGARVVCVTATRGERGTPDPVAWPPNRLADARTVELVRCLEILGVCEHHWLGFEDGGCAAAPASEAVARLSALIDRVRPDWKYASSARAGAADTIIPTRANSPACFTRSFSL